MGIYIHPKNLLAIKSLYHFVVISAQTLDNYIDVDTNDREQKKILVPELLCVRDQNLIRAVLLILQLLTGKTML